MASIDRNRVEREGDGGGAHQAAIGGDPTRASLRVLGAVALVAGAIGAMLVLYAVHGSLPHNALKLPFARELPFATVMPESWRFFTRDPLEAQPYVLRRDATGAWESAMRLPNGLPQNAFGLDRTGRAQNVELGHLLNFVPTDAWRSCDDGTERCLEAVTTPLRVENTTSLRSLCGVLVVTRRKPVPWAWSRATPPVQMPFQLVALEVQC